MYSFLNIFLWSIPIYRMYINAGYWKENYIFLWLVGFMIIFISPVVIALVIIVINEYEILRKICGCFKITSVDLEPSAWDFKFKDIKKEWVIITLSDKRTVAGFIGENSFVSSNSKERDLYLDKVYKINKNGEWEERERTDGIWIKNEEIRSIEFFNDEEGDKKNDGESKK